MPTCHFQLWYSLNSQLILVLFQNNNNQCLVMHTVVVPRSKNKKEDNAEEWKWASLCQYKNKFWYLKHFTCLKWHLKCFKNTGVVGERIVGRMRTEFKIFYHLVSLLVTFHINLYVPNLWVDLAVYLSLPRMRNVLNTMVHFENLLFCADSAVTT